MSLIWIMPKVSGRNIHRQLLRRSLLGFVLAAIILIWFAVGSLFFGYSLLIGHGSSMEPTLHNGDIIWVKQLDVTDVKVGDIVTLSPAGRESVTHRVIRVQPLLQEGYLLETKGDASQFAEEWEVGHGSKVGVAFVRVRFVGQVVEFLRTIPGIVLLLAVTVTLSVTLWLAHRRRLAHGGG